MWWLALSGCGWLASAPVPEGLDPAGLRVQVRDQAFEVVPLAGGEPRARVGWEELEVDPVDASDGRLVEGVQGAPGVWLDLPASLPWYRVRKALGSVATAKVEPVFLSVEGSGVPALRPGEEPEIGLRMSCREGPLPWTGVQPRITVALQRSTEGSWAVANARFLPVVDGVPTDGLPVLCLAEASCSDWYSGAEKEACEAGRAEFFDGRVSLGGEVGCLLPFLSTPDDLASWTTELPPVLKRLGLDGTEPVLVSPEARIRWDTVLTTLAAFQGAGLPLPALAKPLVEGNDGPPLCDATVRDAAALKAAAARRAGTLMAASQEGR